MPKSMPTTTASTVETLETVGSAAASSELLALTALPLISYLTQKGEERIGLRLHSLSYLPERIGEDGKPQSSRFGGFIGEWTDPATGTVRGLQKDSVPLQFFGKAADDLRHIMAALADPKRDAILLGVNGDPAALYASVHRNADGSVRQLAVGTREFRGNFKKLIAAPEAVILEE